MFKRFWSWIKRMVAPKPKPPVTIPTPVDPVDVPDNQGSPVSGQEFVDISHHKTINWDKFNYSDCIMKATEAISHVDSKFKAFANECATRGVRMGFYHYYRVKYDPIKQADHFIDTVGIAAFKMAYHLPIIDFEAIGNGSTSDLINAIPDVAKFANRVTERTGRKCRIYSGDFLMGEFEEEFRRNGMHYICAEPWIARYPNTPKNFAPWSKFFAHQYSEEGRVAWSRDDIDLNIFK